MGDNPPEAQDPTGLDRKFETEGEGKVGYGDGTQESTMAPGFDFRLLCVFAYLFGAISGIIVVVLEKENEDLRFHGWQSILWFVTWLMIYIVCIIIDAAANIWVISWIWWVIGVIVWLVLMVLAFLWSADGKRVAIPGLSIFANRLAVVDPDDVA